MKLERDRERQRDRIFFGGEGRQGWQRSKPVYDGCDTGSQARGVDLTANLAQGQTQNKERKEENKEKEREIKRRKCNGRTQPVVIHPTACMCRKDPKTFTGPGMALVHADGHTAVRCVDATCGERGRERVSIRLVYHLDPTIMYDLKGASIFAFLRATSLHNLPLFLSFLRLHSSQCLTAVRNVRHAD